jgi:hypothetical protein
LPASAAGKYQNPARLFERLNVEDMMEDNVLYQSPDYSDEDDTGFQIVDDWGEIQIVKTWDQGHGSTHVPLKQVLDAVAKTPDLAKRFLGWGGENLPSQDDLTETSQLISQALAKAEALAKP